MKQLSDLLKKNELRLTNPRKLVFGILKDTHSPLSMSEIYSRCSGVDRSSLYRIIDTYIEIGVVKVVNIGWKKLYELTDLFHPHHHHFRCDKCERVLPISDEELEDAISTISRRYGFKPSVHHFEIEGVCLECQKQSI